MADLSFGTQETLHDIAAFLSRKVELYGQQGNDMTEAEFFLGLLYEYFKERDG